jgi:hypothetical protein
MGVYLFHSIPIPAPIIYKGLEISSRKGVKVVSNQQLAVIPGQFYHPETSMFLSLISGTIFRHPES